MGVLQELVVAVVDLSFRVKYSIIIPTFNEEASLISNSDYLQALREKLRAEIIIVDGNSSDRTRDIAETLTDKIYVVNPSRSVQLNKGVNCAHGEYYIFLHADTIINEDAVNSISNINDDFRWGFFRIKLDQDKLNYNFLTFCINLRSILFNYCTGDQVLIVKKNTFYEVNGFRDMELMEDVDIANRLKKKCNPKILNGQAITSSRRWRKYGYLRTILLMRVIRLLFYLGVKTKILAKFYR